MEKQPLENTEITPPLPILAGSREPTTAPEWQIVRTEFAFDAELYRPSTGYSVLRSPFRKGHLALSESGIQIAGQVVRQNSLWIRLMWICFVMIFVVLFLFVLTPASLMSKVQYPLFTLGITSLLGLVVFGKLAERLRLDMTEMVAWNRVQELQCEKQLRWAVLTYQQADPKAKSTVALTLNFKQVSQGGVLRDSVEYFAPGRAHLRDYSYRGMPTRITLGVVVGFGIAIFLLLTFSVLTGIIRYHSSP